MRCVVAGWAVAAVMVLLALHGVDAAGQCYTGTMVNGTDLCFPFVNGSFYLDANSTIAAVQATIQTDLATLNLIKTSSPACYAMASWLLCNSVYPGCADNTPQKVCKSSCQNMYNACVNTFVGPFASRLPECNDPTTYPETDCKSESIEVPGAPIIPLPFIAPVFLHSRWRASRMAAEPGPPASCPSPLIVDPHFGQNISNPFCNSGCCVPCPQADYLFPSGAVRSIDTVRRTRPFLAASRSLFHDPSSVFAHLEPRLVLLRALPGCRLCTARQEARLPVDPHSLHCRRVRPLLHPRLVQHCRPQPGQVR